MKQLLVLLTGTLLLYNHMSAQTKNIDIDTSNTPHDSMDLYNYMAPENWTMQKGNGFVNYRQPLSATGQGCALTIIAPQPSSGNLETDVTSIFSLMYPGWNFHHSDHRQYILAKGYTKQGLAYYMMEADMMRQKGEQWDYETGAAWVIDMGKQIAILSLRHEPIGLYCECKKKYNYIGRLLNTFTIKNAISSAHNNPNAPKRFIGSWMISGGGAIGEYIFAANGHYQYIGAYGSVNRVSPDMIQIKSSAFQGDGIYTINGDKLTIKRKGSTTPEIYRFRFEQLSQGATGWKDCIYLLNEKPADGGAPYEACYEKRQQ